MTALPCFLAALAISFLPDAIALPRPRAPWRRAAPFLVTHALALGVMFLLALAVTARPAFAALFACALTGLLTVVSNAKYESLREPLVFTDLSLFSQLFRHPRLYLPFLSVGKGMAIALGAALFVGAFVASTPLQAVPYGAIGALGLIGTIATILLAARLPLSLVPAEDQQRHGLFAVFVAYLLNGLRPGSWHAFRAAVVGSPFAPIADPADPADQPDVIVIQSESFFDARRLGEAIRPELLANFDAARRSAVRHGQLTVPAWGANTMRTEFSVLTGLPESRLGYARFYPYAFVRRPCASLAGWFRHAAYRTAAIHPYYADFFGRDRVFRLMHFERFLDIRHFVAAARVGPYVADEAVAESIIAELDAADGKPAFVMAMTMENHGPLHLERVEAGEGARYHTLGDASEWNDLTAYLRHLANADAMIGRLTRYLAGRQRRAVLCFYGDHVPALPTVFQRLGTIPDRSDYFIWRSHDAANSPGKDIAASDLGQELITAIGQPAHAASPAPTRVTEEMKAI